MSSLTPRIDSHVRNLRINGDFTFWQRGTSFTSPTRAYTADRSVVTQSGYTGNVTRSTDVPTYAQSGYQGVYSLLFTNGTGASPTSAQFQQIGYLVEGFDYQLLHGKKGRYSVWVKSSIAGTFCLTLLNNTATRSYATPFVVSSANTWTKVSIDIPFDNTGSWTFDNTVGLFVYITLTAGPSIQTSTPNQWLSGNFQGLTGQTQWVLQLEQLSKLLKK